MWGGKIFYMSCLGKKTGKKTFRNAHCGNDALKAIFRMSYMQASFLFLSVWNKLEMVMLGQSFQVLPNRQRQDIREEASHGIVAWQNSYFQWKSIFFVIAVFFHYIPSKSFKRTKGDDGLLSCLALEFTRKHLLLEFAIVSHNRGSLSQWREGGSGGGFN